MNFIILYHGYNVLRAFKSTGFLCHCCSVVILYSVFSCENIFGIYRIHATEQYNHAQQNKVITHIVYIIHMQDHPDTPLLREALAFVQKVTTAVQNLPVVKL